MAASSSASQLPYGIGRFGLGSSLSVLVLLALVGLGLYAYSQQLVEGLVVTGMRDVGSSGGAPWGLYVAFDVYFVGISFAGIAVASLIRLMNLDYLRPIARMAELITVLALILGAFSIIADLGQPMRGLINLWLYARPQSPFFGTFTLVVAGYLFASLVYFYLESRRDAFKLSRMNTRLRSLYRLLAAGYEDTAAQQERHRRASFWLALAILPLLVTAHSTLGFIFGLQAGRPGWHSALQAPGFVVLAGVSGIGFLIVAGAIVRWGLGEKEALNIRVFSWLSNLMMVLTITYLYFLLAEILTAVYAGGTHEVRAAEALLQGEYAWMFWLSAGLLLVGFFGAAGQAISRRYSLPLIVLAGVLVNLAAILKRYIIVVPSLTHGSFLPYPTGSYSPTWIEYAVTVGLVALGVLVFIGFMKIFPIVELREEQQGG